MCGDGVKILQSSLSFGYERLSNHVECFKVIPSLQTLGIFRPKKLTKMPSTEQQRMYDRRDIRHKANRLMEFALQSHSDLRLLVWGTWEEDGGKIQVFWGTPWAVCSIGNSEFVDLIGLEQMKYEIPEAVVLEYLRYPI